MSSLAIFLIGLIFFSLGYKFYASFMARMFGVDSRKVTPAHTRYDGVDYVPAKNWLMLFGHHFSSISGAGPIIGPVIGCIYWGWLPSLIWIVFGSILIGGVHDFAALFISVRQDGVSIAEISESSVSKRARYIFSIFVWLALILVIAVFVHLCAKTFITESKTILPSLGFIPIAILVGYLTYIKKVSLLLTTIIGLGLFICLPVLAQFCPISVDDSQLVFWSILLLVYCFFASVTPVNILLQPRDYLSSYLLIFGTLAGLVGLLISRPLVTQPAFVAWNTSQGSLWPMMCVTIACGAISGFHSLIASGTTSKQIQNERYIKRIGYGGMLVEGVVALLAIVAVVSGISREGVTVCSLLKDAGPICVFGEGYAGLTKPIFGSYGVVIAIMMLNAFILTTLDTATRVCRYITTELMGIKNRFLATFIVVVLAGALALSGAWNKIWPVFGASNQLVAALALFVISCWLLARKKPTVYTLIPAFFMFLTTFVALIIQFFTYLRESNYLLMLITLVLIVLSLVMVYEVIGFFKRFKKNKGYVVFKQARGFPS